jgi:hypothetical protein
MSVVTLESPADQEGILAKLKEKSRSRDLADVLYYNEDTGRAYWGHNPKQTSEAEQLRLAAAVRALNSIGCVCLMDQHRRGIALYAVCLQGVSAFS